MPLSDTVETSGEIGERPFHAALERYTAGPVLQVKFAESVGVEFGAMYKRMKQSAGWHELANPPGGPFEIRNFPFERRSAIWEFPLVLQYRFPGDSIRPLLEGGVSPARFGSVLRPYKTLPTPPPEPPSQTETRVGFVAGGGLEVKTGPLRLCPSLRYTRYGQAQAWLPATDSIDLLVGVTF